MLPLGALALAASLAGACTRLNTTAQIDTGPTYPQQASQQQLADVHVLRRGTQIELTNTTQQTLAGTLWINRWFAGTLAPLAPGQTARLHLGEFRDRFSEPFRAGGFFATQQPDKVVSAQLEPEFDLVTGARAAQPQLIGLIVIAPDE